ncbi:MAG: hypothetical protein OdinLCB4_001365 [Candidatus Odinarchaeum yellowstonii]|uniref:Zinc-ribbon domain-containing protein n=1 Tax=Odinarchaeota yellowstonii (strain LCB_4) TaxID=1841599 RepID=A0AAF0D2U6_ODILC|nr:MAG: hypothetical protein OdinLCB4_001365 [Candidatus Odinarchaeum yellowstonii]
MVERCPKCGFTPKPGDKYCRYCGTEIKFKKEEGEDLGEDILKKLVLKGRLANLRCEKNKYLEELKTIEEDLHNGRGSLIEVEKRLNYLKQQISNIKEEERRITSKDVKMPYEELLEERKKVLEQIEKLDKLLEAGKIDETSYHELREEFSNKISEVEDNFNKLKSKMRKLYADLTESIAKYEKEMEMLTVRYEIGQLDKDNYLEKEKELKNKIVEYKLCLEALKNEPLIFQ